MITDKEKVNGKAVKVESLFLRKKYLKYIRIRQNIKRRRNVKCFLPITINICYISKHISNILF